MNSNLPQLVNNIQSMLLVDSGMKTPLFDFGHKRNRVYLSKKELREYRKNQHHTFIRYDTILVEYFRKLPTFQYISYSPDNSPSSVDLYTKNLPRFVGDIATAIWKFTAKNRFDAFTKNYQISMVLSSDEEEYIPVTVTLGRIATFYERYLQGTNHEFFARQIAWNIFNQLLFEVPVFSVFSNIQYESMTHDTTIERSHIVKLHSFEIKAIPLKFGSLWGQILPYFFVNILLTEQNIGTGNIRKFFSYISKKNLGYYFRTTKTNCFFSSMVLAKMQTMEAVLDFFKTTEKRKGVKVSTESKQRMKAYNSRVNKLKHHCMRIMKYEGASKDFFVNEKDVQKVIIGLQKNIKSPWYNTEVILHCINNNVQADSWYSITFKGEALSEQAETVEILLLNGFHALPLLKKQPELDALHQFVPDGFLEQQMIIPRKPPNWTRPKVKRKEDAPVWVPTFVDEDKVKIDIQPGTPSNAAVFYWDTETFNGKKDLEHLLEKSIEKCKGNTQKFTNTVRKLEKSLQQEEDGRTGITSLYSSQILWLNKKGKIDKKNVLVTLDETKPTNIISNCFGSMLDILLQTGKLKGNNIFVSFNGGKFDHYFAFTWVLYAYKRIKKVTNWNWRIVPKNFVLKNGIQTISFDIMTLTRPVKKYSITFRDAMYHMPGSLAGLAKSAGLGVAKTSFTYEQIRRYSDVKIYRDEIIEYGSNDVVVLATLYEEQRKMQLDKGFDIVNYSTLASLVRAVFFTFFYKTEPIYTSTIKDELNHRKDYKGGKVDAYFRTHVKDTRTLEEQKKHIQKGVAVHADFTSHYPGIGSTYSMPAGKYKQYKTNRYFGTDFWLADPESQIKKVKEMPLFFIEIGFRHAKNTNQKPFFGIKHNGTLIFPYNDTKKYIYLYIWKEELIYLLENGLLGMTLVFGKYMKLWKKETNDMKRFMDYFFKVKSECDSELKKITPSDDKWAYWKSKRLGAKNMINNASGLWAIKFTGSSMVKLLSDVKEDNLKNTKSLLKAKSYSLGYNRHLVHWRGHLPIQERSIFWSIRFTAIGRMLIDKLNREAISKNILVGYNDTDCGIFFRSWKYFNGAIIQPNTQYKQGSKMMGGLTNELGDGKEIEEVIIVGAKVYAYKDSDNNWELKFKGVSANYRYQFREIITVINQNTLKPEKLLYFHGHYSNSYFESNKIPYYQITAQDLATWVKGDFTGIRFSVRRFKFGFTNARVEYGKTSEIITITFRGAYTKGTILADGVIEPLRVSNLEM